MGRAIVRHPQAFLMDEPLSNLDAKLRVQTRAEIARLQHELGVTTIYVTHDQVEAMTMGDRVAVMRKGVLQQVDSPQTLYEHPVNLFVAGFIGSPAMNLVDVALASTDGGMVVELGEYRLPVPDEVLAERPGAAGLRRPQVVLGIRPEDMEDASLVSDAPPDRRITSTVELREALGSDVVVHFPVDAPPAVTEDVIELAADVDEARRPRRQRRRRAPPSWPASTPARTAQPRRPHRAGRRHPPPALLRPRRRGVWLHRRPAPARARNGRHRHLVLQPAVTTAAKENHDAIPAIDGGARCRRDVARRVRRRR